MMTINKRKNLPDNLAIYYSIANRGDPRHLDYELSYVVTSTQNARAHSQCKSKLGWPYALQKMTGAKSIELLLTRLLSANVSEIALSTFRCLVNVYDTMLNAPDCVSERLTMDMDTPQCLTASHWRPTPRTTRRKESSQRTAGTTQCGGRHRRARRNNDSGDPLEQRLRTVHPSGQ